MGFLKIGESWRHATDSEMRGYLNHFRDNYLPLGIKWHRYVHSEHVKVIVESLPFQFFMVRSIFRSVVYYANMDIIDDVNWWIGSIYQYDSPSGNWNLIYSHPPMSQTQFRNKARELGTTGNF